jgi:PDZ domain-containing protein
VSDPAPADGGRSVTDAGRGRSRFLRSSGLSGVVLYALVFVLALTPVPYLLQTPGPVVNTLEPYEGVDLVTISGTETYEAEGTLDMLTVAVAGGPGRDIFAAQAVTSLVNGVETVVPSEAYYPLSTTRDEVETANSTEMISSQDEATAAALTELDIDYDSVIGVSQIVEGSPAQGILQPGDHILSVDGEDVPGTEEGMSATGRPSSRPSNRSRRTGRGRSASSCPAPTASPSTSSSRSRVSAGRPPARSSRSPSSTC